MQSRRSVLAGTARAATLLGVAGAAIGLPTSRACAGSPDVGSSVPVSDWVVVPKRDNALDWATLIRNADGFGPVVLSQAVLALNRTTVEVDGYFLPYVPDAAPTFLMTPYLAHCESCVPNRPFSVVGISADVPPPDDGPAVLTYRGQFVIAPENPSGYPFWILDARRIA